MYREGHSQRYAYSCWPHLASRLNTWQRLPPRLIHRPILNLESKLTTIRWLFPHWQQLRNWQKEGIRTCVFDYVHLEESVCYCMYLEDPVHGLFPHHRYVLLFSRPHPSSLNFLSNQPPGSGLYKQDSISTGWVETQQGIIIDVEAQNIVSIKFEEELSVGKNGWALITLRETARAGPFLKFTSQGMTNGSVCVVLGLW